MNHLLYENQTIHSERVVFTISALNQKVCQTLEQTLGTVWVEGEISNLREPSSGHLYFSLKDERAQVRCVLFRGRTHRLRSALKDGMYITALATISLYEERGDFQLIIEILEESGDGVLQRAFEALKKRLSAEGLFSVERKRALPLLPKRIGVITSPTGAAIRDILTVLNRRFPLAEVVIYPTPVQGIEAPQKIVNALCMANQRQECEVLILARGGGSLEDLWAFNEEVVARAIFDSALPIVSAIGHEIDFTIADFVADQRAATPSAAAELVTPDMNEWKVHLPRFQSRLIQIMNQVIKYHQLFLETLKKRLIHPKHQLQQQIQRLDHTEQRFLMAHRRYLKDKCHELSRCYHQLLQHSPSQRLELLKIRQSEFSRRLSTVMLHGLTQKRQELQEMMRALDHISPLRTLNRGYAIISKKGDILRHATEVSVGDEINARLADGSLQCVVTHCFQSEKALNKC